MLYRAYSGKYLFGDESDESVIYSSQIKFEPNPFFGVAIPCPYAVRWCNFTVDEKSIGTTKT